LGVTQYLPEEDRYSSSRRQLISQLCSLFGGRIAEEMIGGIDGVTTGASNDIERATQLARNMVTKWGLTEKMGPVLYGEDDSQAPGGGNTHYSEDTSREIDQEVRDILDKAYVTAKKLLEDNRDILEAMKDALMEYETIDADQVDDLMARRKVRPPHQWDDNDTDPSGGASGAKKTTPKDPNIGGPVEDL
jgi:cell division protease FtsH